MTFGLRRGTVQLAEYDPAWASAFAEERDRIAAALAMLFDAIEHVGSTAIPGLCSKPIVDIAVAIPKLANVQACVTPLQKLGYMYLGDREGRGDHFFAKGPDECRTHYIHMVETGSSNWREYLVFRDVLRNDHRLREEYAKLKRELAATYSQQRDKYTEAKSRFIKDIIQETEQLGAGDAQPRA